MTAIDASTAIVPPPSYPSDSWLPQDDFFFVPEHLRGHYAGDQAGPSRQQREALYEVNYMGRTAVDMVITDPATGRHRLADLVDRGEAASRGLLSRWRQPQTTVDPFDVDSMALKVWEHQIRLDKANRGANTAAALEGLYASQPRCQICGTTTFVSHSVYGVYTRGGTFCGRHIEAVNLAGAQRDLAEYQAEIGQWLDSIA